MHQLCCWPNRKEYSTLRLHGWQPVWEKNHSKPFNITMHKATVTRHILFLIIWLKKDKKYATVYPLMPLYFAGDSELQLSKIRISTSPTAWIFKEYKLPSSNWQFPKSQQLELWIEETDLDFAWYSHVFHSSLSCLPRADCGEDSCRSRMRCFSPHVCNVCMGRVFENRWGWHSHVLEEYS